MTLLKNFLCLLFLLPRVLVAQSTTDCPTWNKKKKTNYLEYMRVSQTKKTTKSETTPITPNNTKSLTQPIGFNKEETTSNTQPTIPPNQLQVKEIVENKTALTKTIEPSITRKETQVEEKETQLGLVSSAELVASPRETDKEKSKPHTTVEKKKKSKFEKKLNRLFSKKNNKAPKANYSKCSTNF